MGAQCCTCTGKTTDASHGGVISLSAIEERLEATDGPTKSTTTALQPTAQQTDPSHSAEINNPSHSANKATNIAAAAEATGIAEWNPGDEIHVGAFVIEPSCAAAINNMRKELKRQLTVPASPYPEVSGDLALYKFLTANDMDQKLAIKAYTAMLEFRQTFDVDAIDAELEAHWNPEFNMLDFSKIENGALSEAWNMNQDCLPKSDEIQNKEGQRIRVIRPGIWKLKPMIKAVDQETLRRIHIYEHEHFMRVSMIQTKAVGKLVQRCVLQDLSNFNFGPFQDWNMSSFRYVIFSELDPKHYPEEIGRFQIVQAPWAVGMLVKFIKALNIVPARTWEKVHIFTSSNNEEAQGAMRAFSERESFVRHFGGALDDVQCLFMGKEGLVFPPQAAP
jgi:hypothetical protein